MPEDNKNLLQPENINNTKVAKGDVANKKENDKKDDVIEALMKRLERLEKTANKKRLDGYDRLNQEDSETIYKLRVIDGRVIIRWSNLHSNKAEVNPVTRRIEEDQTLTVYYEDETEEKMDLVVFNRRYEYIYTTLIEEKILKKSEEKEKYGDRIYTVETDEGKRYSIGEKFIN
jgi:hypothetical protein